MTNAERNLITANALLEVYRQGAYSSLTLNKVLSSLEKQDKAYVTRLFYGVLSKDIQLNYILSKLTQKPPKPVVRVVIKMGLYMLRYMNMPAYSVIDNQVELTKKLGKRELAGFVNAVLRKNDSVVLPIKTGNFVFDTSVNFSAPQWLVELLVKDYGEDFTTRFFSAKMDERTHIRSNPDKITSEDFEKILSSYERTDCGYYVLHSALKNIPPALYTIQSRSSILACKRYCEGEREGIEVLDTCAAPGGKSVLIAQILKAKVTACDIHEHRVNLINSYANRMGVKVNAIVNDATKKNPALVNGFSLVVCDAPCSGIGVIHSKPDILLNRKKEDIEELVALQKQILETSSAFVKKSGALCYSTCTIVKEENEGVVEEFLSKHPEFSLEGDYLRLYPQEDGCDGFFVAKMRRNDD